MVSELQWYTLKDKVAVPADSPLEAARDAENQDWNVAKTDIGEASISTVFLGQDRNIFGVGDPQLFETMIFGGEHDGWQERCATWDQAVKQHEDAVSMVSMSLDPEAEGAPPVSAP